MCWTRPGFTAKTAKSIHNKNVAIYGVHLEMIICMSLNLQQSINNFGHRCIFLTISHSIISNVCYCSSIM